MLIVAQSVGETMLSYLTKRLDYPKECPTQIERDDHKYDQQDHNNEVLFSHFAQSQVSD